MNPTMHRSPGRQAARAFAAMALAATSFLVPGVAQAEGEATAGPDTATQTEGTTLDAATANTTEDNAAANPETPAAEPTAITSCEAMRAAPQGTTATLDRGHADIFDLTSDASGALTLRIKEDATGSGVLREPEQTLLAVSKSTLTQIPTEISKATGAPSSAYLLGQSGDNQATVLWPGWDTLGITAGGYNAARFHVTYSGPRDGRIYAFTSGLSGNAQAVTADHSFDLAPEGDDIDQPYPAHKHVNWLFTRAGRYVLTVQAGAWAKGATGAPTAQSAAHTYTIDVADEASCVSDAAQGPNANRPGTNPSTPGANQSGSNSTADQGQAQNTDSGASGGGATDNPPNTSGGATTGGKTPTTQTPRGSSGGGAERCVATRITREATEAEAATLASSKAPANTARTKLTFSVGDGASGNATDGHFDLGPAIENGTLVARIKDDRSQPAQWVDPSSLTFALGDAARISAPADLSFVASAGSSVWLIPSTQIAGVPWLGLNSQREEIVTGTTGGVQFSLDAVEGPGRVAVFNAGALGSGVGEHVFDGPGSTYTLGANTHAHQNWVFTAPGTYTLTISMRVTPNGAALSGSGFGSGGELTATGALGPNGRPMVSQVVGRTASGKDCDLSLATTGADTIPLAVVSLTWALTGAACVWVGAIGRRRLERAKS